MRHFSLEMKGTSWLNMGWHLCSCRHFQGRGGMSSSRNTAVCDAVIRVFWILKPWLWLCFIFVDPGWLVMIWKKLCCYFAGPILSRHLLQDWSWQIQGNVELIVTFFSVRPFALSQGFGFFKVTTDIKIVTHMRRHLFFKPNSSGSNSVKLPIFHIKPA